MIAAALKHMFAAGMSQEAIIAAVEDMEASGEMSLTPRQARNKRYYERLKASKSVLTSESDGEDNPPYDIKTLPQEKPQIPSVSTPAKAKRGSRLPDDWHPAEALWSWGTSELGLGAEDLRFETSAFRDHFWGSARANAAKRDWDKAWKNWMREAFRRGKKFKPKGNGTVTQMSGRLKAFEPVPPKPNLTPEQKAEVDAKIAQMKARFR